MVNELSMFEPLKFYCIFFYVRGTLKKQCSKYPEMAHIVYEINIKSAKNAHRQMKLDGANYTRG